MKNRYFLALALIAMTLSSATAQRNRAYRSGNCANNAPNQFCLIDNLTDEQQQQMDAERVKFQKEILANKNKLGELQAKKRTLETTEPINEKALDNVIIEINSVKTDMQKKHVRHQQSIKSFLTDDQVVAFDNSPRNRGPQMGKGNRGNGHYQGRKGNSPQCQYNAQGNRGGRGKGQGNRDGYGQGNAPRGGQGNGGNGPRGMSDELREKLDASRLELVKQEQPVTNKLNELNAQMRTLTTGKSIDLKKVDKLIDEKSALQLELARLHANHRQEVRSQLSDEEKIWFDNRPMNRKGSRRPI